jgi:hypothetical protein
MLVGSCFHFFFLGELKWASIGERVWAWNGPDC